MRARVAAAAALALTIPATAAVAAPLDPVVSGGSVLWTNAGSVIVSASGGGPGVASYEYRVSSDSGTTWQAPASAPSVTISSEGETWVQFRSVDGLGGTSAWAPAHVGSPDPEGLVRLDRLAPDAPAPPAAGSPVSGPPALTWTPPADVGAGVVGYRVLRDGVVLATTTSAAYTDAAAGDGVYAYRVRAVDGAGNVGAASAPLTVVRDTSAPSVPVVSGGSDAPSAAPSAAVTATGGTDALTGPPTYEWRTSRDGGASWSAPAAGGTATVTDEGETLVQFRSVDGAGNRSAWWPQHAPGAPDPSAEVVLDRTPPPAPGAPGGGRYPVVLRWDPVPGASAYDVLRDGAAVGRPGVATLADPDALDLAPPPAPRRARAVVPTRGCVLLSWPALADAGTTYTYSLRARDAVGNVSPEGRGAEVRAASGVEAYAVRVDGRQAGETAGTTMPLCGLDPARTHVFTLQARDRAGNVSAESASLGVRPVPGALPQLTLTASDDAVRPGAPVTLTARVTGRTGGEVSWDLGDGGEADGPRVVHRYAGEGRLTVVATVPSLTGRPVRVRRTLVVDGTPPHLTLRMAGDRLLAPARDAGAGVARVVLVGAGDRELGPGGITLSEGPHRVRVRAEDRAGNAVERSQEVVADGTRPHLRVTAPGAATGREVTGELEAGDGLTGLARLTLDGRPLPLQAAQRVTLSTGGAHVIEARDAGGNVARVRLRVPRVAPAPARGGTLDGVRRDQLLYRFGEPALGGSALAVLRETQARLVALGLLADGPRAVRYGEPMLRAVQAYQRDAGLPALGTIGPRTRAALARDAARPRPHDAG